MRVLLLIFSALILMGVLVFPLEGGSTLSQSDRGIGVIGEAEVVPVMKRSISTPTDLRFATATSPLKGEDKNPRGGQMRIVSTSLCGDSYVLSMIPHKDIAALSWQSADALSRAPTAMRGLDKAWDDPERLLALKPSLVIFGPGEGTRASPLLDKAGIRHVSLVWGEDFKTVSTNRHIISEAAHIETPQIGANVRLARTRAPLVLYLSSSGGTAGAGTYVDAAITRAGGENIITKAGWHTPDPETLIGLKPDLIVTSFFNDGYASVNEAGLRNKAVQSMIDTTTRVNVPGKLWPCAGPGMYEAADIIYDALRGVPDE